MEWQSGRRDELGCRVMSRLCEVNPADALQQLDAVRLVLELLSLDGPDDADCAVVKSEGSSSEAPRART